MLITGSHEHPIRHQFIFSHRVMLRWLACPCRMYIPSIVVIILIVIHIKELICKVSAVLQLIVVKALIGSVLLKVSLELGSLEMLALLLYAATLSLCLDPILIVITMDLYLPRRLRPHIRILAAREMALSEFALLQDIRRVVHVSLI